MTLKTKSIEALRILPLLIGFFLANSIFLSAQTKAPIMGWSSWNNFRININEEIIKGQVDAMVNTSLYDAGYRFINIDDGFFGGRDSSGEVVADAAKFPSGMKSLAAYIHSKNLKADIYTDVGKNTCGSIYDKDKNGFGVGILVTLKPIVIFILRNGVMIF